MLTSGELCTQSFSGNWKKYALSVRTRQLPDAWLKALQESYCGAGSLYSIKGQKIKRRSNWHFCQLRKRPAAHVHDVCSLVVLFVGTWNPTPAYFQSSGERGKQQRNQFWPAWSRGGKPFQLRPERSHPGGYWVTYPCSLQSPLLTLQQSWEVETCLAVFKRKSQQIICGVSSSCLVYRMVSQGAGQVIQSLHTYASSSPNQKANRSFVVSQFFFIIYWIEVEGPSGPRLLAGGPSSLLTSSFAPFGRSGRVTPTAVIG